MRVKRAWPWWALAGGVAAWLLWMTLRPNPSVARDLAPLTQAGAAHGISPHVLISLAGNIAVFVPLGFCLALALRGSTKRRLLLATLIGAAFSLAIEIAQSTLPSRVAALDDVALNTLGVGIGALMGCWAERMSHTFTVWLEDRADLRILRERADESARPFAEFQQEFGNESDPPEVVERD